MGDEAGEQFTAIEKGVARHEADVEIRIAIVAGVLFLVANGDATEHGITPGAAPPLLAADEPKDRGPRSALDLAALRDHRRPSRLNRGLVGGCEFAERMADTEMVPGGGDAKLLGVHG